MKCATKYCRHPAAKNRRICNRCILRRYKANNPLRVCFTYLRSNARRRGKAFSLTFEQFCYFCAITDYMRLKGRFGHCLSVNRKVNSRGYHFDNIEATTVSENIRLRYAPLPPHLRAELEKLEAPHN